MHHGTASIAPPPASTVACLVHTGHGWAHECRCSSWGGGRHSGSGAGAAAAAAPAAAAAVNTTSSTHHLLPHRPGRLLHLLIRQRHVCGGQCNPGGLAVGLQGQQGIVATGLMVADVGLKRRPGCRGGAGAAGAWAAGAGRQGRGQRSHRVGVLGTSIASPSLAVSHTNVTLCRCPTHSRRC